MIKCANCAEEAEYVYQITSEYQLFYCNEHLPRFIRLAASVTPLVTLAEWEAKQAPAKPSRKTATAEPVVEEPVVEAPAVEDAAVSTEEPAATK